MNNPIETHPCYNEKAQGSFARMHLPVAPHCNIQCNYCNRKFDCMNESRPGVTSEVLSPKEALEKIAFVKEKISNLSVIGIAGPGDPLANESTFETIKLVKEKHPELTLCISTNGLLLPDNQERLHALGVRFVTVTMNSLNPETAAEIYSKVIVNQKVLTGIEGARTLIESQKRGIEECVRLGMFVKVNIVMIPEINVNEIPKLVKEVKGLGAHIVNILPLIPVQGTQFEKVRSPTPSERKELIDLCSSDAKMMRHCRQCRADAIGLLGEDRSGEFIGCGCQKQNGCGPSENSIIIPNKIKKRIAVASSSGKEVDAGFGNADAFFVYSVNGNEISFEKKISVQGVSEETFGPNHKERINAIANLLSDCDTVIVAEIGNMPRNVLEARGIKIFQSTDNVRNAITQFLGNNNEN